MSEHCYLFLDLLRKLDRWMCRREFFTDPPRCFKVAEENLLWEGAVLPG